MNIEQARVQQIRDLKTLAECIILDQWPAFAQRNCALGLYDDLDAKDPYHPVNMKAGITGVVNKCNAAIQKVNELKDVNEILSVQL